MVDDSLKAQMGKFHGILMWFVEKEQGTMFSMFLNNSATQVLWYVNKDFPG